MRSNITLKVTSVKKKVTFFIMEMKNKNFAERLNDAFSRSGLKKKEISEKLSVSHNTVMRWFRSGSMSKENIERISDLLKISPEWLLYGKSIDNVELANLPENKQVPIVSWVQAGERHMAFVEEDPDEIDTITTYVKCSEQSYALRVNGESMTTSIGPYSFPEDTIIIVDPEQKGDTTNGVFVIAKKNGEDGVHFKQLKYEQGRPYLHSLNPDKTQYKNYYGDFRIIGKVVDYRPVKLP